ncbi:SDR family oxidoreductase [Sphingomonas lacunae]|uniref:SDR family oxidoreductase n=1 Tax=Sphingomonas lacunae TaxID=2698828 RepID=A0A6M4ARJ6_9SPHN|nr:SDR family NAD(P)-dependent oxidoreductase [Sphingomonas lacunae]QJQ31336.1 SDR family oxidoreductase [Sphingomonas lacunae]
MNQQRFAGKSVLVTGAASGIGRATALLFAREGARLTIGDINADGLAETVALIGDRGAWPVRAVHHDAEDHDSSRALVAAAAADGLDILCNVAGMLKWGPTESYTVEDFERLLRINTTSVFVLCQAALPHLVASKGNIVCVASTAGLSGIPYSVAYAASKHAVVGMIKSLALEYAARGVRVNGVAPGQVATPMTRAAPPQGDIDWQLVMRNVPKLADGICDPEDIAEALAFLASDASRKTTGAILAVDGGQLAG